MLKPEKETHKHTSLITTTLILLLALLAVSTTVLPAVEAENMFSNATNLGLSVNSPEADFDPSISADGLELYFNSYRSGGFGNADIWVATRKTEAGPWGKPVNLGASINSPAHENAPYISADGLSLYFCSDRSGGCGGRDVWVTKRKTRSDPWGEPVNLGPSVNSAADEHGPSISSDGLSLYFSGLWDDLKRSGGLGQADISIDLDSFVGLVVPAAESHLTLGTDSFIGKCALHEDCTNDLYSSWRELTQHSALACREGAVRVGTEVAIWIAHRPSILLHLRPALLHRCTLRHQCLAPCLSIWCTLRPI